MFLCPIKGVFHPCLGILFTRSGEACFSLLFFPLHSPARQFTARAPFPVTSWQLFALRAPRHFSDGTIRQGFPSCRIPTIPAATTSPCASQASLAFRGVPHASTCALPVRNLLRALCEQNAQRRPHGALHTRSPGEPIRSKFTIPAYLLPVCGVGSSTACVSGPDLTRAGTPAAASCEARHGPRARCRANPARLPK